MIKHLLLLFIFPNKIIRINNKSLKNSYFNNNINHTHNGYDHRLIKDKNITIEILIDYYNKKKHLDFLLNENISIFNKIERLESMNNKYYIGNLKSGGLFKDFDFF